ncbi:MULTISPECIES: hypothetical protein [unclassified Vibrio]|uniref:hypothetical protein n=1 Tax=unclassified Vibrio TaxID=2614977 RepID=UPI00354C3B9F
MTIKDTRYPFAEHLNVNTFNNGIVSLYHHEGTDEATKRLLAVRCALELINSDVSSGGEAKTYHLGDHFSSLSAYADLIQKALEV